MTALLELKDVYFHYGGYAEPALRGVSLRLEAGQKVVLIGRNGSGKSTLLLHCNGILRPDSGTVQIAGQLVRYDRRSLQEVRRRVGIVFQNPDDQLFSASVAQDISFGPLNLGLGANETQRRVQAAAEVCEISDLLERPTHALSGGQKARVALAGILAMEPDLIIADEVTASLDPWMRQQILAIFERLVARGRTVLLATHELEVARHWADIVVVLDAGQIIAAGTPAHVFADQSLCERMGPMALWYTLTS